MMRRVVQFSTGNVGRHALRAIIGRPDLELVGVHASGANKIGRHRRPGRVDRAEAGLCRLHGAGGDPAGGGHTADRADPRVDVVRRSAGNRRMVDGSPWPIVGVPPGSSGPDHGMTALREAVESQQS